MTKAKTDAKGVNTLMKPTKHTCRSVVCLKRRKQHPLLHHIHKKHNISYKTLFYMKEYGPHSHVAHTIFKESIKILLLTSIISSIGGIGLQHIERNLLTILPLLILLPALNNMIGAMGTIISSKFTTMLYLKKVEKKWWREHEVHKLIATLFAISTISSVYITLLATAFSVFRGFQFTQIIALKILALTMASTIIIVSIIFLVSIIGGIFIYKRKEDPNNFLIPISTSIADFGSMLVFVYFVALLF
ncbi:MAG: magnesium transporter [Candidatus Aenigmarchaeota archaeon]|nr:magnesium transporter [Candidatus Aenigmarchaeota archaeon]